MMRMQIYQAMLAEAATAALRLERGSNAADDIDTTLMPLKAARMEGVIIPGVKAALSFWGYYTVYAHESGADFTMELEREFKQRLCDFIQGPFFPLRLKDAMEYCINAYDIALSGARGEDTAIKRWITEGGTEQHWLDATLYSDYVANFDVELRRFLKERNNDSNPARGAPGGKRVSKYLGRENITGDGDYLGWALSVPNGHDIVSHKSGDTRRNAVVYKYVPAAVPIIDALIDAFQDSKRNGWINPHDPDLRLIEPGGKWQNKFSRSATLKKAIESEGTRGKWTGRIRLMIPHGATKAKR